MSIVDNLAIVSWERVYGNESLEKSGCGEDVIAFSGLTVV